jgi:hypothetical protein
MKIKIVVIDWEIPPRVKRWALRIAVPAVVVAASAIAYASVPISFIAHGPLTAADLNADFTNLDGRVTALETLVPNATHAVSADSATNATHATSADTATSATSATTATTATSVASASIRLITNATMDCRPLDGGNGPATRCYCAANEIAISGGAFPGLGNELHDSLNLGAGSSEIWEVGCANTSGVRLVCPKAFALCLRVQ